MKITALETVLLSEFPNLLWLQLHTDQGVVGLGETFFAAETVSAYLHEMVAPYLLGQDPRQIDRHARALYPRHGFRSNGAELRGNSAVDIALWDILGQATGQPVYQLIGGLTRERIPIYNTCAGYGYIRHKLAASKGRDRGAPAAAPTGPYEDLQAFMERPAELAQSLLAEGVTAMKIWPFDSFAEKTDGLYISAADLRLGLEPFRKIREAVGDRMEIMVEMHRLWNLPSAVRIARALEEFEPFWLEDAIKPDNLSSLRELAARTTIPICASEVLGSRWAYLDLLEQRAADIIMVDLAWAGGLSEARKIASMAETYNLPITAHDCTGPVTLTVSVHFSVNVTNAILQENVRAFYTTWYQDVLTELPPIEDGAIAPPSGPGLGTRLQPSVLTRPDATIRRSDLA